MIKLRYFNKYVDRSEHPLVVLSSLAYCLVGAALLGAQHQSYLKVLLVYVGMAALLHHTFPDSLLFRVFDWTGAVVLVFVTIITNSITYMAAGLFLIAFLIWLISLYYFHKKRNLNRYTLYHTLWHVLSSLTAYIILTQ